MTSGPFVATPARFTAETPQGVAKIEPDGHICVG